MKGTEKVSILLWDGFAQASDTGSHVYDSAGGFAIGST